MLVHSIKEEAIQDSKARLKSPESRITHQIHQKQKDFMETNPQPVQSFYGKYRGVQEDKLMVSNEDYARRKSRENPGKVVSSSVDTRYGPETVQALSTPRWYNKNKGTTESWYHTGKTVEVDYHRNVKKMQKSPRAPRKQELKPGRVPPAPRPPPVRKQSRKPVK